MARVGLPWIVNPGGVSVGGDLISHASRVVKITVISP
jgi:hypothetical protein